MTDTAYEEIGGVRRRQTFVTVPDAHGGTAAPQSLTPASQEKLKQFVARIERLDEEIKALKEDRKDVFGEAKALGFDVKAIRAALKFRTQDKREREEQEAILELYLAALGDI